jgi:mono/diheme cytochrome c family protein
MKRSGAFAAVAIAMACLLVAACGKGDDKSKEGKTADAAATDASDPVPGLLKVPADVARGKAIFVGTCGAYCHKMTTMESDAPNLLDCDWLHGGSDEEIFHTITHGVPGTRMVAFGGAIPDADIWRIVAYLKSASECNK